MNNLKEAHDLVASFSEPVTLDLSSASDELDLSAAADATPLTAGRLLGAFAYTVRQTPGVMASTLKSYRNFSSSKFQDVESMDEPLDPFVADYRRARGLDAGRTVFDEHFDRLPRESRIRAQVRMEQLAADGMPEREAFKQSVFEEIKSEEKSLMDDLTGIEKATMMPKDYKQSTGFLEDVARGIGTSVGSMAGFMLGGPPLATAMAYGQMHGYKVQELEEMGVTDPTQLLKGGMASGALQAPLEAIGAWAMLSRVMKANGTWASWLLKTAEGALGEGITEFIQQYPDVYATLLALNPDVKQSAIFSHMAANLGDITEDALYAGAVGAVSGGVTTGAGASVKIGIEKLITTEQKAINEERANRIDFLVNKGELTPDEEGELRNTLNLAEDADVKKLLQQAKKQFELDKPIKSEKREAAKEFHEKQLGKEQAEANIAVMDALARSAAEKGWVKNPAEFYDKLTFVTDNESEIDEAATEAGLFQVDVWHGSPHRFDKFKASYTPDDQVAGISFDTSKDGALAYAQERVTQRGGKPHIYKTDIDNFKLIDEAGVNEIAQKAGYESGWDVPHKKLKKLLSDAGYDGIDYREGDFFTANYGVRIFNVKKLNSVQRESGGAVEMLQRRPDLAAEESALRDMVFNAKEYDETRQGIVDIISDFAETTNPGMMVAELKEYAKDKAGIKGDLEFKFQDKDLAWIKAQVPVMQQMLLDKAAAYQAGLRKLKKQGFRELYQAETEPRGKITLKTDSIEAIIKHFKAADASTTIHELGHFVTGMLWEQGDSDYLTLAEYAGVDSEAALSGLSGWSTEQLEKVARAFEAYLMEGKSPSQKLQQAFQRMKEWLVDIYRSIKALNVELTDEVRDVFDRLLTTEIERAENPFLEVQEWLNTDEITKRELARRANEAADMADMEYGDLIAQARELAVNEKKKRKAGAEKKLRAEMMKDAERTIENEPFYEMLDELIANGGMKQSVVEGLYDKALIRDIQTRRPGIIGKEGISPDTIGEQYGYISIDGMIQDILNKPDKKTAIQAYFDGLWGEYQRYEHLSWAETYEDALEAELSIFNKITGKEGKPKPARGLKKVIREVTGIVKTEELKQLAEDMKRDAKVAREAWNAARKAMREEMAAITQEQREKAIEAKQKAIAKIQSLREDHLERIMELKENFKEKQRRDKYIKNIKKVIRSKSLLPEYRSQIAAYLTEYMNVPPKFMGDSPQLDLVSFLESKRADNEYIVDSILAEYSNKPQQRRNAKGYRIPLTADELENVYRTVKQLEYMARGENMLITAVEKIELKRKVNGMVDRMYQEWGAPGDPVEPLDIVAKRDKMRWYNKLGETAKKYFAEIRKPEFIFDGLDGWKPNGPNAEVMRDIKHASDEELTIGGEYVKKLQAIFKKHIGKKSAEWAHKWHQVPGVTVTDPKTGTVSRQMTKERMIMIALNSGNEGNLTALREGYNLTDEQIQAVYDALSDNEKALIEDIWQLIDTLYPKLNEIHKTMTGVTLPKVEGRYFPLVFERELSWKADSFAQKQIEKDLFSSAYTRPNVAAGHRVARTGGKMAPELSFNVIAKHLVQTVHDITHQIPVRNSQKIIADPAFREGVTNTMGDNIYRQLMPWLANIARPMREPNSATERFISRVRANSTVVGLGLRFSTAMLQPLAYTQTIDEVGFVQSVKALSQFYSNPKGSTAFVNQSSATMANRKAAYDRDIRQIRDGFDKSVFKNSEAATNAFFYMIDVMDAAFRYPSWLAGYNVEMDRSGDHTKAVDYADKVVAKTQGLGLPKDLAMIQRGGPMRSEMVKLLTMFYSFFSVFANRFMDTTTQYRLGKISTAQAAKSYFWILILPALLEELVRRREKTTLKELLLAPVGYLVAGFPFVRDIISPMLSGYRYTMSPVTKAFELPSKITRTMMSERDDKAIKLTTEALELSGYVFGLPTGQAITTMDGIIDLMEGKTSDPSVLVFRPQKESKSKKAKPSM